MTVGNNVRCTVFQVEIVECDERIADEMGVRSLDGPESGILMQELFGFAGENVEQSGHVDLNPGSQHTFDKSANAGIEKQVVDGTGFSQEVVRS